MFNVSLSGSVAFCEAQGFALCFQSYAENCSGEEINCIGFNSNSGYVYIYLENGVSICSCMGQSVEFLITDNSSGEELFYESYQCAIENI